MINTSRSLLIVVLFLSVPYTSAYKNNLLEMSDQLDALDKIDFQQSIDKANSCTRARNFKCTESELAKATKLAVDVKDREVLSNAQNNLKNEKIVIAKEEIAREEAEQQRQAQLERDRENQRQREIAQEEANQSNENMRALFGALGSVMNTYSQQKFSNSNSQLPLANLNGTTTNKKSPPITTGREALNKTLDPLLNVTGSLNKNLTTSTVDKGSSEGTINTKKSYPGLPMIRNSYRRDDALNKKTYPSWCNRTSQEVIDSFKTSEDKFLSIESCTCKDSSMTHMLQTEYTCILNFTYQQNVPDISK